MKFDKGSTVYYRNEPYSIVSVLNFDEVLAKSLETAETAVLKIQWVRSLPESDKSADRHIDLENFSEEEMKEAKRRFEIIKPIIKSHSRKEIEEHAESVDVAFTTLYNWLRAYRDNEKLSSLVPRRGRGGKGKSRLSKEQEVIVDAAIEEFYKSLKNPLVTQLKEEIDERCDTAGIKSPSLSTIRRRIDNLDRKEVVMSREGKKRAKSYKAYPDKNRDALYPMHILEMDHTLLDIVLVDDKYRLPLKRPWISVAIDDFSRMITGFYISFEAPGYFGTGQVLTMTMLQKNAVLEKYEIEAEWPVWGKPVILFTDNAKEFWGKGLDKACDEYGISKMYRSIGKTELGGIVERVMREVNKRIHILDGTTNSSVKERGEYDSEREASITLSEFEQIVAIMILEDYHNRPHKGIGGKTPLQKYKEGIFGTSTQPPVGLPDTIDDVAKLKIDLLPFEERQVERYGVQVEKITYYGPVLNKWIGSYDPDDRKRRRRFTVRKNPHNVAIIYFYDPMDHKYYEIDAPSIPKEENITIWEWRAMNEQLNSEKKHSAERDILKALRRVRKIADESAMKTKRARKNIQRRQEVKLIDSPSKKPAKKMEEEQEVIDPFANIEPFEDIDEGDLSDLLEETSLPRAGDSDRTNNDTDPKDGGIF